MRLAFIKNGGGFRKKFFLPLVYLIWMQLILLSKLTCGLLFSDCFNSYLGLVSSTKSATFVFHFLDKLIINYLLSNKTRPVHFKRILRMFFTTIEKPQNKFPIFKHF